MNLYFVWMISPGRTTYIKAYPIAFLLDNALAVMKEGWITRKQKSGWDVVALPINELPTEIVTNGLEEI